MDNSKKILPDDQGNAGNPGDQGQNAPVVAPKLKEQSSFAKASAGEGFKTSIDYAESDKVAKAEGDEYWESYAREIELEKQILEMGGIEKVEAGEVKVPEQLAKEMGISPTTTIQTPMETATGFSVSGTSMDDSQLSAGISKPTSSGLRWLVEWFILQLLKANFHIKRIKGTILREKPSNND